MHHEELLPVRRPVDLDEVVAAAERSQAAREALRVPERPVAAKVGEREALLAPVPDAPARGHEVARLVDAREVEPPASQADRVHAAPDVHAHQVGNHLVDDGHGRADGAAHAGMRVGHDGDARAARELLVAHGADLLDGGIFDLRGVAGGGGVRAFDFKHLGPISWHVV